MPEVPFPSASQSLRSFLIPRQPILPSIVKLQGDDVPSQLSLPLPNHFFKNEKVVRIRRFDDKLRQYALLEQPEDVDFSKISKFVKSSCDQTLINAGLENNASVVSSTSSTTSMLSHVYFLVSDFSRVNMSMFGPSFSGQPNRFTVTTRKPCISIMSRRPGVGGKRIWVLDAPSKPDDEAPNRILMDLGHVIEKKMTMPAYEFQAKYLLKHKGKTLPGIDYDKKHPEVYNYSKFGRFLVRSQLDCYNPELPGTSKVFDLKSRCIQDMRWDILNYKKYLRQRITKLTGRVLSFESEIYDMTRSALLKYYFQVRLGRMSGIFVAYHNTVEIFGVQYFSQETMEKYLDSRPGRCSRDFSISISLMDRIMQEICNDFDVLGDRLAIVAHAKENHARLDIFVEAIDSRPLFQCPPLESFMEQGRKEGVIPADLEAYATSQDTKAMAAQMENWTRDDLIRSADTGKLVKYILKLDLKNSRGDEVCYNFQRDTSKTPTSLALEYMETMLISKDYPADSREKDQ